MNREPDRPAAPATVLLATRSAPKVREIRSILGDVAGLRLLTLDDVGCDVSPEEEAVEAHATFEENAAAKARFFAARTGLATVADDSGLVVDALGGDPGVRSKRFAAATVGPGDDLDAANNARLLAMLRDVPAHRRTARFVCAAALALPDAEPPVVVRGTCEGLIAGELRGEHGFGYDPLFLVPELGRTFGEVPASEKQKRSHRARAFRALAPHIRRLAATASREP